MKYIKNNNVWNRFSDNDFGVDMLSKFNLLSNNDKRVVSLSKLYLKDSGITMLCWKLIG